MEITLHYSTKIGTIKKAFNKEFPYLKIEFLAISHTKTEAVPWMDMVMHNRYLGEINNGLRQGSISISEDYNVASFEQLFQQHFELPVMVFRKQKKTWIKANSSEELTLFQQNEIGKESCFHSLNEI